MLLLCPCTKAKNEHKYYRRSIGLDSLGSCLAMHKFWEMKSGLILGQGYTDYCSSADHWKMYESENKSLLHNCWSRETDDNTDLNYGFFLTTYRVEGCLVNPVKVVSSGNKECMKMLWTND